MDYTRLWFVPRTVLVLPPADAYIDLIIMIMYAYLNNRIIVLPPVRAMRI